MDRTRRGRFCSSNYILEALEKQRNDRILRQNLSRCKADVDNKTPQQFEHLDGRARNWRHRAGQINKENMRLLDSLKDINESDYQRKTEKVVGRMSIGNVGKSQTLPKKPWSDCFNEAVQFIRPKDTLSRPQKNEQRRVINENVKLLEKITTLKSPYDHARLVREYNETTERNDRIRATQPLDAYLARVKKEVQSPSSSLRRSHGAGSLPNIGGSRGASRQGAGQGAPQETAEAPASAE